MQKPRTSITPFETSADKLYETVLAVAGEKPYTLAEQAEEGRAAIFSTGKTMFSWGHEFAVMVIETEVPAVELHVMCGGVDGRPTALLDGRKNAKAGAQFVSAVTEKVAYL